MDPRLARLIHDYLHAVATAVALLEAGGIPRPTSVAQWVAWDVGVGTLPNGCSYFKHGLGCKVSAPGLHVDFDFRANGEIDGFSGGWLADFAGSRVTTYGFWSPETVRQAVRRALERGEIVRADFGLCRLAEPSVSAERAR